MFFILKRALVFALGTFCLAGSANAQMVKLNSNGTIQGDVIHQTKNFSYYRCEGIVSENLVRAGFSFLEGMSKSNNIPPPRSAECIVHQGRPGTMFAFQITVDYFISETNSRCFYENFCNDTRAMSFMFKQNKMHLNFMVINAAKKLTKQVCVGMDGKIAHAKGCGYLK